MKLTSQAKLFDVIIIGGSIAGSVMACQLSRLGLFVALVDRSSFPRRKACGEGLSRLGVDALRRVHLWDSTWNVRPFEGFTIHRSQRRYDAFIGHPVSAGIAVQRLELDTQLHTTASRFGAELFTGNCVTTVRRAENGWSVHGTQGSLEGRFLVLADGVYAPVSRMLKIPVTPGKRCRLGMSWTLRGAERRQLSHVHIMVEDDYEVYCTPLAQGRVNICILADMKAALPKPYH